LGDQDAPGLANAQGRRGFAGEGGAEVPDKDRLPELHPEEQRCDAKRRTRQVLVGKGAAAHVGPEKQHAQHKGKCADVITGQGGGRGGAQLVDGLFDQLEGRETVLAAVSGFHSRSHQLAFHTVFSWKEVGKASKVSPIR